MELFSSRNKVFVIGSFSIILKANYVNIYYINMIIYF